ncbi:MAG: DNA recombination protein RmuC [Oligoflexia bacterium]|nr:DNA recombination protein RmuC [Oligoflexia bacterium]
MESVLLVVLGVIIVALFLGGGFYLLKTLLKSFEDSLSRSRMELRQNLQLTTDDLQKKLESIRTEVDQKLSLSVKQNFDSMTTVSKRLEELQNVTGQVVSLSQGVKDLSRILETPKLRGAMGEFQLAEMLREVLPEDSFEEQFLIDKKSKEQVDAVIKLKEGYLCIDSKFPLSNAKKIFDASTSDEELKLAQKAFAEDVKQMAASISEKYIIPDKTLDFAFMFIPTESVYYELMKNSDLHQYCLKKHVIPVSPNSFYAYLQAIAIGFRGLKIQNEAKKIEQALLKLKSDFQKFGVDFEKVGKHLKDAQNQYNNVEDRVAKFGTTIDKLGLEPQTPEAQPPSLN